VLQFVPVHGGRAQFLHHQAARHVADSCGLTGSGAGHQGRGQDRDDRVPGAGNIEHFPCQRGNLQGLLPLLKQAHPPFPQGDQHRLALQPIHQPPPGLVQASRVGNPDPGHGLRFQAVGGDEGYTAVKIEVIFFRIHRHNLAG